MSCSTENTNSDQSWSRREALELYRIRLHESACYPLNGYRHFGDLRYLSDVAEGRFKDVRLLQNPPAIDRVMWAFSRMAKSVLVPLKSHNMNIYRKKLLSVANDRNGAARAVGA